MSKEQIKPILETIEIESEDKDRELSLSLEEVKSPEIKEIVLSYDYIKEALIELKKDDEKTFQHTLEVARIANYLIKQMGNRMSEEEAEILMQSAMLHDYGKTRIDKELLNKTGLDHDEKKIIKNHVRYSFEFVKSLKKGARTDNELKLIENIAKVVVKHHEWQKDSYPRIHHRGLDLKETTNKISRIISMIDAYEAMLSKRPDNPPRTIGYIKNELNNQFPLSEDKEIIFLLDQYYIITHLDYDTDDTEN